MTDAVLLLRVWQVSLNILRLKAGSEDYLLRAVAVYADDDIPRLRVGYGRL